MVNAIYVRMQIPEAAPEKQIISERSVIIPVITK
jgi:hypothetical protein